MGTSEKQLLNIVVESQILDGFGEVNEMTLYTSATYNQIKDKSYLMYDESELTGMAGTKTLLTYDGQSVHIKRYGENTSTLIISPEVWHENAYHTPYGLILMKTFGKSLTWEKINTLNIHLTYLLEIEGETDKPSVVTIKIESK